MRRREFIAGLGGVAAGGAGSFPFSLGRDRLSVKQLGDDGCVGGSSSRGWAGRWRPIPERCPYCEVVAFLTQTRSLNGSRTNVPQRSR